MLNSKPLKDILWFCQSSASLNDIVPFSDMFPKCLIICFINLWFLQEVSESRTLGFRLDGLPLAIKSTYNILVYFSDT